MQAAFLEGPRTVVVRDAEKPKPGPDEVLVRVGAAGVCGSDVHFFKDFAIGELVCEGPHILGHEFGGLVEEVGSAKYEHLLGKRVAVEPSIP